MGLFGKKIHHLAHTIGKKVSHVKKFAGKVSHAVHHGLHVAGKVAGAVESVAGKVHKIADKVSGIPVIGAVAGAIDHRSPAARVMRCTN